MVNCGPAKGMLWKLPPFPYMTGGYLGAYCTTSSVTTFKLVLKGARSQTGGAFTDYGNANIGFIRMVVYKIAPLAIDAALTTVSAGSAADITYFLKDDAPGLIKIAKDTGVIEGYFDQAKVYAFGV